MQFMLVKLIAQMVKLLYLEYLLTALLLTAVDDIANTILH